jgi:hypothetical protein
MKVGIVVPVRNCLALTQAAVASIKTRFPYQVYIIDDHSDPPMKDWLASRPDIASISDPPESTGLASNWNLGIAAALNDGCSHILVSNNDVLFHPRTIDILVDRISRGDAVVVTGNDIAPQCTSPEDLYRRDPGSEELDTESPDFSLFMITPDTIRRVGWFDESYHGAYYEDNDYHAVIALSNEKAIRCHRAIFYHYGNRTFAENRILKPEIQARADQNGAFFLRKWGHLPVGTTRDMRREYLPAPFGRGSAIGAGYDHADARLAGLYRRSAYIASDINEHGPYLHRLASTVRRVTAFSAGSARASSFFAYAKPDRLDIYDEANAPGNIALTAAARYSGLALTVSHEASLAAEIVPTDLLFLDTVHVRQQLHAELQRHSERVSTYIAIHDTETFGIHGEVAGSEGIRPAIDDFLRTSPQWRLWKHFPYNNGLTVLTRVSQ